MDELESISQLIDNLQSKLNLATKRSLTYEELTTWNSKLLDVQQAVEIIQNAFFPINQLLVEIMHHILDIVLDLSLYSSRFRWAVSTRTKCLLKLTAVCQRWRHIAIANTLFWTDIEIFFHGTETSNPDGMFAIASEFLVRSRPAPVRVRIMTPGPKCTSIVDSWIVEKLSKEFYRLEEFGADIGLGGIAHETLYLPAPNLKTLCIMCDNNPGFPVLPPIFNSYFPNLQKLDLAGFSSLPVDRFTNLTSLTLGWKLKGRMSGSKLLDVLPESPALEELNVQQQCTVEDDVRRRLIHLPCLKVLMLDGCNFEFIITHIAIFFPQIRRVLLDGPLYYIGFKIDSAGDVLSGIPQEFLHELISKGIDSLSLSVEYSGHVLYVEVRHSQLILKINQPMSLNNLQDVSFLRRSFNVIANMKLLTSIIVLTIRGHDIDEDEEDIFSAEFWDSWFSRLDRLEHLQLERNLLKESCTALLKENPEGNLPCAQLQVLEFEIEKPSIEDLDLISEVVMGRHTKGLSLSEVGIVGVKSELEQEVTKEWENLCNQYAEYAHFQSLVDSSDETSSVASNPSSFQSSSSPE